MVSVYILFAEIIVEGIVTVIYFGRLQKEGPTNGHISVATAWEPLRDSLSLEFCYPGGQQYFWHERILLGSTFV